MRAWLAPRTEDRHLPVARRVPGAPRTSMYASGPVQYIYMHTSISYPYSPAPTVRPRPTLLAPSYYTCWSSFASPLPASMSAYLCVECMTLISKRNGRRAGAGTLLTSVRQDAC